ncbi:MAG: hypothetical protein IJG87_00600 [Ruminococcus sp.]|nr:hypothetical protein [Ruminococcus sp.]
MNTVNDYPKYVELHIRNMSSCFKELPLICSCVFALTAPIDHPPSV